MAQRDVHICGRLKQLWISGAFCPCHTWWAVIQSSTDGQSFRAVLWGFESKERTQDLCSDYVILGSINACSIYRRMTMRRKHGLTMVLPWFNHDFPAMIPEFPHAEKSFHKLTTNLLNHCIYCYSLNCYRNEQWLLLWRWFSVFAVASSICVCKSNGGLMAARYLTALQQQFFTCIWYFYKMA